MAWVTWVPPQQPSQAGSKVTDTPRVLSSNFGDGYVQRAPDGINYLNGQCSLTWNSISETNWLTITQFFEAHFTIPFLWQLPDETTPRQWVVTTWSKGWLVNNVLSGCTATLMVDFTPG
jgi:phage-related protein